MMAIVGESFYKKYKNTAIDYDGVAGVQCVDLFKLQCKELGKNLGAIGGSGYAKEIYKRFSALGLSKIFTRYSYGSKTLTYGDWLVWNSGALDCPDSHVAMFVGWNGSRILAFGYNQAGKRGASIVTISPHGLLGFLRPIALNASNPKEVTSQVVKDVIAGKYGNGQARVDALEKAGYDYDEVQGAVNDYLSGDAKAVTAEVVNAVIRGDYGNGSARKTALEKAGYDYEEVQKAVNAYLAS